MEVGISVRYCVSREIISISWDTVRESIRVSIDGKLSNSCMDMIWVPIEDMLLPIDSMALKD